MQKLKISYQNKVGEIYKGEVWERDIESVGSEIFLKRKRWKVRQVSKGKEVTVIIEEL